MRLIGVQPSRRGEVGRGGSRALWKVDPMRLGRRILWDAKGMFQEVLYSTADVSLEEGSPAFNLKVRSERPTFTTLLSD